MSRGGVGIGRRGRELLDGSHQWQRRTFAELIATWFAADRQRFAGYLLRVATELDLARNCGVHSCSAVAGRPWVRGQGYKLTGFNHLLTAVFPAR